MRLAVLVVLAACRAAPPRPLADQPPPSRDLPDASTDRSMPDYPSYPGARALTDGRVYGSPPARVHISWTTMATADLPSTVVAHYEQLLGQRATTDGKTWSFTAKRDEGATSVSRTLEIIPAAIAKDFPGGDVPPAPSERTVILSSIAMGPR